MLDFFLLKFICSIYSILSWILAHTKIKRLEWAERVEQHSSCFQTGGVKASKKEVYGINKLGKKTFTNEYFALTQSRHGF